MCRRDNPNNVALHGSNMSSKSSIVIALSILSSNIAEAYLDLAVVLEEGAEFIRARKLTCGW